MRQQSNTALYVVGGCIAVVAVIVIAVRASAPPAAPKDKNSSPLAGIQFGPGAASAMPNDPAGSPYGRPPPGADSNAPMVDVSPALINGKPGLVIRYEVDAIDERKQQMGARALLAGIRADAEAAGVETIVVVAAVPAPGDAGAEAEKVHKTYFARTEDGWAAVEPPGSARPSLSPSASAPPSASAR